MLEKYYLKILVGLVCAAWSLWPLQAAKADFIMTLEIKAEETTESGEDELYLIYSDPSGQLGNVRVPSEDWVAINELTADKTVWKSKHYIKTQGPSVFGVMGLAIWEKDDVGDDDSIAYVLIQDPTPYIGKFKRIKTSDAGDYIVEMRLDPPTQAERRNVTGLFGPLKQPVANQKVPPQPPGINTAALCAKYKCVRIEDINKRQPGEVCVRNVKGAYLAKVEWYKPENILVDYSEPWDGAKLRIKENKPTSKCGTIQTKKGPISGCKNAPADPFKRAVLWNEQKITKGFATWLNNTARWGQPPKPDQLYITQSCAPPGNFALVYCHGCSVANRFLQTVVSQAVGAVTPGPISEVLTFWQTATDVLGGSGFSFDPASTIVPGDTDKDPIVYAGFVNEDVKLYGDTVKPFSIGGGQ